MQQYHRGFQNPTWSSFELKRRLNSILVFHPADSVFTLWPRVLDLAGDVVNVEGKIRWPFAVYEILQKNSFANKDRLVWSGFCYQNGVPFGLMVAYAHFRGALRDEAAYADLLNSWCDLKRPLLDSMVNLMTYDRYISYLTTNY